MKKPRRVTDMSKFVERKPTTAEADERMAWLADQEEKQRLAKYGKFLDEPPVEDVAFDDDDPVVEFVPIGLRDKPEGRREQTEAERAQQWREWIEKHRD
jgi:hypothetical protein